MPAAAFRWPIWLLIEPTATRLPASMEPNTSESVFNSVASPTRVLVPCASMSSTVPGS